MSFRLVPLTLFAAPIVCLSQATTDSPQRFTERLVNSEMVADKMLPLPESLLPVYTKIDSIRNDFNTKADSLQRQYQKAIASIDANTYQINQKIDSLQRLKVSTNKYKRSLNKLSDSRKKTEAQFTKKLNSLKTNTAGRLKALDLPPKYAEPLQTLTGQIDRLNLNNNLRISELKIPGYEFPDYNDIGMVQPLNGRADGIEVPKIPGIDTPREIGNVSAQIQGYQDQTRGIASNDITDIERLPETIESQATRIDGIEELQKQPGLIDDYKSKLEVIKDPTLAKPKAVKEATKAAVDHFAGKEKQLKAAMVKISTYKQKYSSVSSLKNLPKRPLNPMKAKPFVERLTPGLYLQYQQRNFYLLDINPYLGYKLTGRLTGGLGWNHRYAYDGKHHSFATLARVFGPRAYVDFKVGKGFIAHLEGEIMNSFVPSLIIGNADTGHREWVWSFMTGIKKEYKIYKNLKGSALIQYNLFNRFYKAPYVDRFNSRIGFEYTLKKTKPRKSKN